jgi:integrase
LLADPEEQDYLNCIKETMARVGEINQLTWNDVNFEERYIVLYTRKKKGGHLSPRKVPMTNKLYEVLSRRYAKRDKHKAWVFWHTYWSSRDSEKKEGPYQDRKKLMSSLCQKAGVKYFRFHALRHFGASILDGANVSIGCIQRILGHEQRTTTEIYLHSIGNSEREAMNVFETVMESAEKVTHQVTHQENVT